MPLYQTLNPEIINFDSPDLTKRHLDFLSYRYSDRTPDVPFPYNCKDKKSQEAWLAHMIELREEHDS